MGEITPGEKNDVGLLTSASKREGNRLAWPRERSLVKKK